MERPKRQLKHLIDKVALKESRSKKKAGKRAKRWRKWVAQYTARVEGTAS